MGGQSRAKLGAPRLTMWPHLVELGSAQTSCSHSPRPQIMMAADQTAQDTLRLQFKAMQEMQQRRLQKQMEKRKEKELNLVVVEDQNKPPEMSDGFSVLHAREQHSLSSFQQRYGDVGLGTPGNIASGVSEGASRLFLWLTGDHCAQFTRIISLSPPVPDTEPQKHTSLHLQEALGGLLALLS